MTSSSSQSSPPAEQTTTAEPGITESISRVQPRRPELTPEHSDGLDPRPSTLATQEIRLALTFTGGVSLAVWMGGVARELDLLVQASAQRRVSGRPEEPSKVADPLRRYYRGLLDLIDAQVAVDVLAGTSAGGINAALLGLANVRGVDLGQLRDVWLTAGDLGQLLRDPKETAPASLLRGDGRLLPELIKGVQKIADGRATLSEPRRTDVFITTTLLSPELARFSDDYGTQITDTVHQATFHFDENSLAASSNRADIVPALALAARSSASFPGAFEPSFVPVGTDQVSAMHPDMSPYINTTRSHWVADGGLLVNRPIAPVLQSIFDREADRQVRRVLLYIVPTSGPPAIPPEDDKSKPLGLAAALLKDLNAITNQSIAADLAALKEHNDRTHAVADTRLRLAALGTRLRSGQPLADVNAWSDYGERQADWLVAPLIAEVSRQLAGLRKLPESWQPKLGVDQDAALRAASRDVAREHWPTVAPRDPEIALAAAVSLGRAAFDAAKATLLRMLHLGYVLADAVEERNSLARLGMHAHEPFSGAKRTDLRSLVTQHLKSAATANAPLEDVVRHLSTAYIGAQGTREELTSAWRVIAATARNAVDLLTGLARPHARTHSAGNLAWQPAGPGGPPSPGRRLRAAEELSTYLEFLGRGDMVVQLLDLHIAVRSVMPVLIEVEQPVELIQVSADTGTLLAPKRCTAASKLTGLQVHHFGALYATSWRANDWMWGRLDGCGWLVHMLLDPHRIVTVMENDRVPCHRRVDTFVDRLSKVLGVTVPEARRRELGFLEDDAAPLPPSLPNLALWVAANLQQHIVSAELPTVAAHLETEVRDKPSIEAVSWLTEFRRSGWRTGNSSPEPDTLADLLAGCPVSAETLRNEAARRTPRYLRTVSHAAAVATAAGTGITKPPRALRPTFATARTVTQTAYAATSMARGERSWTALIGFGLLALGVVGMATNVAILGLTGVTAFGVGALLLALCLGSGVVQALRVLLAAALLLLAAAPWIPWLHEHGISWLTTTAIPWLSATAVPWISHHTWAWPVLLFLVLLPPFSTLYDVYEFGKARVRRRLSRAIKRTRARSRRRRQRKLQVGQNPP